MFCAGPKALPLAGSAPACSRVPCRALLASAALMCFVGGARASSWSVYDVAAAVAAFLCGSRVLRAASLRPRKHSRTFRGEAGAGEMGHCGAWAVCELLMIVLLPLTYFLILPASAFLFSVINCVKKFKCFNDIRPPTGSTEQNRKSSYSCSIILSNHNFTES